MATPDQVTPIPHSSSTPSFRIDSFRIESPPTSHQTKRKNSRRPRRSTTDKPHPMFKPNKNPQTAALSPPLGATNDINTVLVRTKLIELSAANSCTESLISSWLSSGWFLPTQSHSNGKQKKKKRESIAIGVGVYKCKIEKHGYITCMTLPQCLNYTFQEFLRYEWAKNIYCALITRLSLTQKTLLFYIGSRIHCNHCIVGKEAVDWMITNFMAKTRCDAIMLGQSMINAGYLRHISNAKDFEDNTFFYSFNENLINADSTQSMKIVDRLYKHNEIMQSLVKMSSIAHNMDINEFMDDIKHAFYYNTSNNTYVCCIVDYVSFDNIYECLQFILNEFWQQVFAQNIYHRLCRLLTVAQQCKIMSIGLETKTRKYRLKKYKNCFIGSQAINWLTHKSHFVANNENAVDLGNIFMDKGLIKNMSHKNKRYLNANNIFYTFDTEEIEKQCTNSYNLSVVSKFTNHSKLITNIISMTLSPSSEVELFLDLSKAFYLPRTAQGANGKFISKLDENLVFSNVIETLHFILITKWDCDYAQVIYRKLIHKLSTTQCAKLFSLGIARKTRKKHFKKYKDCFVGSEACKWLVSKGFCSDSHQCIQLGAKWVENGFIAHVNNEHAFKNEALFYTFNDIEINKQCLMESYQSQTQLQNQNNTQNIITSPCNTCNISPCIDNLCESVEYNNNNIFFNNIDYSDHDDYVTCSDSDKKDADDTYAHALQPVIISNRNNNNLSSRGNNLSVYSTIAVHNFNLSRRENEMALTDVDDSDSMLLLKSMDAGTGNNNLSIDLMASITDNTPEPQIQFVDDSSYFMSVHVPTHKSMATRITHDVNESHASQQPLLADNAASSVEENYVNLKHASNSSTSSYNSQRSHSHSRYNEEDENENDVNCNTLTGTGMDSVIFDNNRANFSNIIESLHNNNIFDMTYSDYTPTQIGI